MARERLFTRAIIRLSSSDEDVPAFLQGLVTNDVTGQLPVWAGLLSPQGKLLFEFLIWPAENGLLIDCEADAADDLIKRLSLYRLRRNIEISRDDTLGAYWQAEAGDGGTPDPRLPGLGQRWIAKISEDDQSVDDAWLNHRLSLGVPEGRAELGSGDTLWLECNAIELNGVSFSKGCYVGQENTARMNWRKKINRRLVVVPLDRSKPDHQRIAYATVGYAIDHLRVEHIGADTAPKWMDLS